MDNCSRTMHSAIACLLSASMLLTAVPGRIVYAAEVPENAEESCSGNEYVKETDASEMKKLTSDELYQIDGGDAEYWKYYDADGNRITREEEYSVFTRSESDSDEEITIVSPYNGNEYSVLPGYKITHAIDVSKNNYGESGIDWDKVKEDGIESVIVRCAYRGYGDKGNLANDIHFEENIEGALETGLKVGVYIYSQAINTDEAVEEAKKCLDLCEDYLTQLDLPIIMDVEYANPNGDGEEGGRLYNANLTRAEQTAICEAFCKTIEDAGYQAMVYANKYMLSNNMNPSDLTDMGYKIWLACYNSYTGYEDSPYLMWQYSSSGTVSGISGNVDLDFLYTSLQTDEAPVWNTVTELKNGDAQLTWNMVPGTEGYEIQRSTDQKNWSDLTSLEAAAAIHFTDSAVEEGSTYYYRIRTYNSEEGENVFGLWSDIISITLANGPEFEDVPEDAYYSDAVKWAYKKGITEGIDEKHFAPGTTCTRGQVITFLWRAEGKPKSLSSNCTFVDISSEDYYYDAVLWAYEKGITYGIDNEHFQPDYAVTRGQFVTFLHRAMGEPEPTMETLPFEDVSDDAYYWKAVLWAAENEITEGVDKNHFEPEKYCNRGEVVTFLYRAY